MLLCKGTNFVCVWVCACEGGRLEILYSFGSNVIINKMSTELQGHKGMLVLTDYSLHENNGIFSVPRIKLKHIAKIWVTHTQFHWSSDHCLLYYGLTIVDKQCYGHTAVYHSWTMITCGHTHSILIMILSLITDYCIDSNQNA